MKKHIFPLIVTALLATPALKAEEFNLTNWGNIDAYANVSCVTSDAAGRVFCGANGGVTVVDGEKTTFLNSENGLTDLNITAIAYSKELDAVLLGTYSGTLQIISHDLSAISFNDIARTDFTSMQINSIATNGKYAYIGGEFGMAVFDLEQQIFTQTITKIADFSRSMPVNNVFIHDSQIYIAGDEGVAKANLGVLLQNPGNWTALPLLYPEETTPPATYNAGKVTIAGGELYATVDANIYRFSADTLRCVKQFESYIEFKNLSEIAGELYITTQFALLRPNGEAVDFPHPLYDKRTTYINDMAVIATEPELTLAFAYKENGAGIARGSELTLPNINSAIRRIYSDVTTDAAGNLWLATGQGTGSRGFGVRTASGKWFNETASKNQNILDEAYFRVYNVGERIFFANWGKGTSEVSIDGDTIAFQNYTTENSPLTGMSGDAAAQLYTIGSGFDRDLSGNIWFVNSLATTGKPLLIKLTPAGTFETVTIPAYISAKMMMSMKVDVAGTKWLGSTSEDGLLYVNEAYDVFGKIKSSGTNLCSDIINSIEIDASGMVWIGTSQGLNVILNPTAVLGTSSPVIRSISNLAGEVINDIYIDAIDNKWLATNNGIFVLSADGTEILANISTKNSPLESNTVQAITSFPATGEMVFATDQSLQTAFSLSVEPAGTYDISCYPQPYNPALGGTLTINGLSADNTLKIVTTEGRFIRTINAAGGRAVWDGRDFRGELVGTGVYLILASAGTAGEHGVGKIAIKRGE